jgi:hypothetical protein
MIFYESLQKLMKATIFYSIFFVKSLTFVPFCSIAMHYWHFVISYCDKEFFSVCCCTVLPFRLHQQIFRHRQTEGSLPNIADT